MRTRCKVCGGLRSGPSPTYCPPCSAAKLRASRLRCRVTPRKSKVEMFWDKVRFIGAPIDACWEFDGARDIKRYGRFNLDDRSIPAQRVAWEFSRQDSVPEGMYVCHRCDNPPCCNPDHLFLGFPKDNTDDMVAKGRDRFFGWHT